MSGDYYQGHPAVGSARPAHTGISRTAASLLVLVVVVVLAFAASHLITVRQVLYRPGPVFNALDTIEIDGSEVPIINVEGLPTYETSGQFDLTTIIVHGGPRYRVTAWDWLVGELSPSVDVYPEAEIFPEDVTAEQVAEQSARLMRSSQDNAAVVALRAADVEVPEKILVAAIMEDAPSGDVLQIEDEMLRLGDVEIDNAQQVSEELQEYEPGDEVSFTIVRDGEEMELQVPTGPRELTQPDGSTSTRTAIGIEVTSVYDLPYDITIEAGSVGGNSGGLMFALAVYDIITPGELSGGNRFAGTGTVNSDGTVGGIGGVRQKMIGATEAGAEYFLAPAANCDSVRGNEPDDIEVIRIEDFDQALGIVTALAEGQDVDLPRC